MMRTWFSAFLSNSGVVGEIFIYLWRNKQWWLIPLVIVIIIFGILLVFAAASGVGPFIYTLF
jgi:hypothetical protein